MTVVVKLAARVAVRLHVFCLFVEVDVRDGVTTDSRQPCDFASTYMLSIVCLVKVNHRLMRRREFAGIACHLQHTFNELVVPPCRSSRATWTFYATCTSTVVDMG